MKVEVDKEQNNRKSRIHYSDLEDDAVKQTMRDLIGDQLPDLTGMDVSVSYNSLTGIVT